MSSQTIDMMNPAAYFASLGTKINAIVTLVNEVKADVNLLRTNSINRCYSMGQWAEGTNDYTIKNAAAIYYTIAGKMYTKAITDNIAMTALAEQANATYCMYLVSVDAAATVTITKGTAVATDAAVLPAVTAGNCAVAAFKIATSGGTFTSGTTDLAGAGVTDTWYDLSFPYEGASASTAVASTDAASV